MSQLQIGWYQIEESFEADCIDMAIRDERTGEVVALKVEYFEDYDRIIRFLEVNQQIGDLERLKAAG